MPLPKKHLFSFGHLCVLLNKDFAVMERAIKTLRLQAEMSIDGTHYYGPDEYFRLDEHFKANPANAS